MGLDYMLDFGGHVKGKKFVKSLDFLVLVDVDDETYIYEVPDEIYNLDRKLDDFVWELKSIEPVGMQEIRYIAEWCQDGYHFTISDGMVEVFGVRIEYKFEKIFER